ncbi:MAG: hypothetical protein HOV80_02440 [Polyangiaceae bacterium]|nr:hypothetical protein [Polyangiaceae bacterium]
MRRALSTLGLFAIAALTSAAFGGNVDPSAPGVVHVGRPRAHGPVERVDLARTGRATTALPSAPAEVVRRSTGVGAQPPVVLADGTVVVAMATPEVARFGSDGAELGRTRIGTSAAVRPPVVLADGGIAVLTGAPSIVFLRASGKIVATVALSRTTFPVAGAAGAEGGAFLSPTLDGGVVIAAGRSFAIVDPSGRFRSQATLPERERFATDLVRGAGGWLAVSQSGNVFALRPPAAPKKVGSFGAAVASTPALADERTLVAQVGAGRIVAVDLRTGGAITRATDPSLSSFDGPFVLDKGGATWVTTSEGLLLGFGPTGDEIARAGIDRPSQSPTPGPPGARFAPPVLHRALLLADPEGRVAFARAGGKVGVRSPDGRVMIAPERGCTTPLALLPAGPGKMVLSCREGGIVFYGNAAEGAASP